MGQPAAWPRRNSARTSIAGPEVAVGGEVPATRRATSRPPTDAESPSSESTQPPSFLTRPGADDAVFAFDLDDDDATGTGDEAAATDEERSSVRRFLFGKKEKAPDEDFFSEKKDRDFEW